MAIRKREELLESLKPFMGDSPSDEAIALLEDITDTLEDYETRVAEPTDWKLKYEENDKQWKERYQSRFFNKEAEQEAEILENEQRPVKREFSDLFGEKGE